MSKKKINICPHHFKALQKLCFNPSCQATSNYACQDCMPLYHNHANNPQLPLPICALHNMPQDKICFDPDCKVQKQDGCFNCMEMQHTHQPRNYCLQHKNPISKLCLSVCEQPNAFGCETCMLKYHNHKKQLIIDLQFFMRQYNRVVKLGDLKQQIRDEKSILTQKLFQFFNQLKSVFYTNLRLAESSINQNITNYYFYEHEPETRKVIGSCVRKDLALIRSRELGALWRTILQKKDFTFTINQVKKHCQFILVVDKVVSQIDSIFLSLFNSDFFKEFAPAVKYNSAPKELLSKYLLLEKDKWKVHQEDQQMILPAELAIGFFNSTVDHRKEAILSQRIKQKDDRGQEISSKATSEASDFQVFYKRGQQSYKKRHLGEALTYFKKAQSLKPDSYKIYNSIGAVYFYEQNFELALENYDKSIKLNPTYSNAINNKANVLTEMGRIKDAFDTYELALRVNPHDFVALNGKGNAHFAQQKYVESLVWFEKAILVNQKYSNAHNNRGNALFALNRFEQAVQSYATALQYQPMQQLFKENMENAQQRLRQSKN